MGRGGGGVRALSERLIREGKGDKASSLVACALLNKTASYAADALVSRVSRPRASRGGPDTTPYSKKNKGLITVQSILTKHGK